MVRSKINQNQKSVSTSGSGNEPSGAQKRKKLKLQEQEVRKLQKTASTFFKSVDSKEHKSAENAPFMKPGTSNSDALISQPNPDDSDDSEQVDEFQNDFPGQNTQTESDTNPIAEANVLDTEVTDDCKGEVINSSVSDECQSNEHDEQSERRHHFDIFDPSTWTTGMSASAKEMILTTEMNEDYISNLPQTEACHYYKRYYNGNQQNGEPVTRTWLRVSKSSNSLFCVPCCFFAQKIKPSPWGKWGFDTIGFQDFSHHGRGIYGHEASTSHIVNFSSWQLYLRNLQESTGLTSKIKTLSREHISHWKLVLRAILDAILYLAQNDLPFQGNSHNFEADDCGNFLNLIKLLSKYHAPLAKHLENHKKKGVSYLSPMIQNDFITLCGTNVKTHILKEVRKRKYYSIMFDGTPDRSHQDQISQIIRTVDCSKSGCEIKENFIDYFTTNKKTGEALTQEILSKLSSDGLEISNCKGQGYDNGSNMAGVTSGVQARILEKNRQARFIPCAAHSLNRVGVNAAEKVIAAKLFLGVIQNLYNYFAVSTSRWEILKKHCKLSLKCQSETRWSSKANAVNAVYEQYAEIRTALIEISESDDFKADAAADALSRLRDISTFKFLLGLTIWSKLLSQINLFNISLQCTDADISTAEKNLSALSEFLLKFKETGFDSSLSLARQIATNNEIDEDSGFSNVRRGRGIHPRYMEPGQIAAARLQNNIDRFKEEFFEKLMQVLIREMNSRFKQIRESVLDFSFLWGNNLILLDTAAKENYVKDLCLKYPDDLNTAGFVNEIQSFLCTVKAFTSSNQKIEDLSPLDVLNILYKNDLSQAYCNCSIALRIFLTLPVSVANNERAFSKLKIIKNYLRTSMSQERLSSLAILSIEKEVSKSIDFDHVINKFVTEKSRRINELC